MPETPRRIMEWYFPRQGLHLTPDTQVTLSGLCISDFHRLEEIVEAGRAATRRALPKIRTAIAAPVASGERATADATLHIDPVCRMTVSTTRARATCEHDGNVFYFCSTNCRDIFVLHAERFSRPGDVRPA